MTHAGKLLTRRLELIPASASLMRAEMRGPRFLSDALGVQAVDDWPPQDLADALPLFHRQLLHAPHLAGWFSWYWLLRREDAAHSGAAGGCPHRSSGPAPPTAVLVGGGGFAGPPEDGRVEIGYHVREAKRRQGYAAEAVQALLDWAFAHNEVGEVVAETAVDNRASMGLLEKLGFIRVGGGSQPGLVRFAAVRVPRSS
jgi:RimJ/RimL family protein N-acetyltransferase